MKQMFIQAAWEFLPETLRGYYWCRSNGSLLQRDCTLASLWRTSASISPVAPLFCSELDLGHININFIFPDPGRDTLRNDFNRHFMPFILPPKLWNWKIFNSKDESTPEIFIHIAKTSVITERMGWINIIRKFSWHDVPLFGRPF